MLAVKTKNNSNKQKKLYPLFFYKDVWDLQDVFFERYRENCSPDTKFKSIDFSIIENNVIRDELKEFAYKGLIEEHLKLSTLAYYFREGKMERHTSSFSAAPRKPSSCRLRWATFLS